MYKTTITVVSQWINLHVIENRMCAHACVRACVHECVRVSYVVDDEGPLLVLVVGVARVAEQGRRDRDVLGYGPDDEATLGVLYARHPLVALQQQQPVGLRGITGVPVYRGI